MEIEDLEPTFNKWLEETRKKIEINEVKIDFSSLPLPLPTLPPARSMEERRLDYRSLLRKESLHSMLSGYREVLLSSLFSEQNKP